MNTRLMSFATAFTAALAFIGTASAATVACTPGGTLTASSVGSATTADATFALSGGPVVIADACQISNAGNGGNTNGTLLGQAFPSGDFTRIAKLNEAADSPFMGLGFTLTATGAVEDSTSGTWTLSWAGGPANLDLVLAIHAANRSGLFFFDDRGLSSSSNGTGSWTIHWLNNGGQVPGFSNLTVWARAGAGCIPGAPGCLDLSIPEPGAATLLGVGGLLAGMALRRRNRSR